METIVKAKDQQAAEANKNASILLKELDLEKVCIFRCPVSLTVELTNFLRIFISHHNLQHDESSSSQILS